MSEAQCPLRFVCKQPDSCATTGIEFDTLDGYPADVVDTHAVDEKVGGYVAQEGFISEDRYWDIANWNEVSNSWPMPVCDGSGAKRRYGDYGPLVDPRDRAWLRKLGMVIQGTTWVNTLKKAVEDHPNAPWVDTFQAEISAHDERQEAAVRRSTEYQIAEQAPEASRSVFHKIARAAGIVD